MAAEEAGMRSRATWLTTVAACATLGAAVAMAGCGGSDDGTGTGATSPQDDGTASSALHPWAGRRLVHARRPVNGYPGTGGKAGVNPGTGGNTGVVPGTGGNTGIAPGTGGNTGVAPGTGGAPVTGGGSGGASGPSTGSGTGGQGPAANCDVCTRANDCCNAVNGGALCSLSAAACLAESAGAAQDAYITACLNVIVATIDAWAGHPPAVCGTAP